MGLLSFTGELCSTDETATAVTVEPTPQQQDTATESTNTTANTAIGSDVSQADVSDDVANNVAAAVVLPVALNDAQLLQLWMKAPALAANCISVLQHDQPDCADRVTAILDTLDKRSQQCTASGDAANAQLMLYARQQLCAAVQYCAGNRQSDDTRVLSNRQKLLSHSAQTAFAIEQKVRAITHYTLLHCCHY
jgi:hypothetical protein